MCSRTLGPAIEPSLVMCPIRITGTSDCLAYARSLDAHSLTWLTEPAEDSRSSAAMVCMGVYDNQSGLYGIYVSHYVVERCFGHNEAIVASDLPMRSARILSCAALSSPLT